ncbi:unnamed protein product [Adineta steineri]|uniref:LysM domain-containing protein n=1 Tax=Adineta steineri TaxID=433720 RepID=A0A813S283_9BILA|nr:unnamed protein product [Adineta steineri]CAF3877396.1 unnamed protein product [Adineta steineri]
MSKYTVQRGDTLWDIAKQQLGDGNRFEEIKRANNLSSNDICAGQQLIIPGNGTATANHGATNYRANSPDNASVSGVGMSKYTVQQGDTLWKIADQELGDGNRFEEIKRANNLSNNDICAGQKLIIPRNGNGDANLGATNHRTNSPDNASVSDVGMSKYTVQDGDTLWKIAEQKLGDGNRFEEIKRANNLSSNDICAGQKLNIPSRKGNGATNHGDTNFSISVCSKEDKFVKAVTSNGYGEPSGKYDSFIKSCNFANIATESEAAMYLATLLHESAGLSVTEEMYNPASINAYGKYIGRGYIQLSSEANYQAAWKELREYYIQHPEEVNNIQDLEQVNFVKHPENVSRDPHAWNVSAWYWKNQVQQHVNAGFRATVTKGIRPLEPHMDSRVAIYEKVCLAFGVSQHL